MLGFEVEVVGDGEKVKEQSPKMGALLDKTHAKIVLYTTDEAIKEKQTVKVPNLSGMTAVAANGTLTNLGLNIRIFGTPNYLANGVVVVKQSHAPGETVEVGTVIDITFGNPNDGDMTFDPDE
jgi:beta-lactam-binding protein with PASTA domain